MAWKRLLTDSVNNGDWNGLDLAVEHGGTGRSSLTSGYVLTGNGTSPVTLTAAATFVTNAGALMDSELTSIQGVKDLDQLVGSNDDVNFGSVTSTGEVVGTEFQCSGSGSEGSPAYTIGSSNDGFYHLASGDTGINVLVNNVQEFLFKDGGDFHADGDVIAKSTTTDSDKRLKKKIKPLKESLADVMKLRPVSFEWKIGEQQKDIGLIAQEVQKILPDVVKEKNALGDTKKFLKSDTKLTIDYSKLVPVLIGSIKELSERIEYLESKI